ncbi:hypothetical protein B0A48_01525 [Cryoendolithus antarcticus]|uniref:Uncharacterized protein n=1 Tax=Cryoendolithus antarcticus TaxID=1507870 RepID=A0A1V8TPJ2_9PEZI|nr:hypothetical protein B0A48_01525 [Cryoendolithus antarcticus]
MAKDSGTDAAAFESRTEPLDWTGIGADLQQDNEAGKSEADDGSSDMQDESLALEADTQHSSETYAHVDGSYSDDEPDAHSEASYSDAVEVRNEVYSSHLRATVERPSDSYEQLPNTTSAEKTQTTQPVDNHPAADGMTIDAPSVPSTPIHGNWPDGDTLPEAVHDIALDDQERCDQQIYSESSSSSVDDDHAENIDIDVLDNEAETTQQYADPPHGGGQARPTHIDHEALAEPFQPTPSRQVRFSQPAPQEIHRDYSRTQHPSVTPRTAPDDDTHDLLRVIEYKLRQKEQSLISAFNQERAYLEAESSASHEASADLDRRVHRLREDLRTLKHEKQKADADIEFEQRDSAKVIQDLRDTAQSRINELQTIAQLLEKAEGEKNDTERTVEDLEIRLQGVKSSHADVLAKLETAAHQSIEQKTSIQVLETKVVELESTERKSLADSIVTLRATFGTQLSAVADKEVNLTRELQTMQQTLKSLNEMAMASPSDCAAVSENVGAKVTKVEKAVHALATTVDSRSDDEAIARINSIVMSATQTLHHDLISWQSTVEQQDVSDKQEHAKLAERLQNSLQRAMELETQLESAKSAQDALIQDNSTRDANIDGVAPRVTAPTTASPGPTREEVETQVAQARGEGYAEGVRFMSDSATSFRMQEQATHANAAKEVAAERDTAVQQVYEKAEQAEMLSRDVERLQSELTVHSNLKTQFEEVKAELQSKDAELEMAHSAANEKNAIETRNKSLTGEIENLRSQLAEKAEAYDQLTSDRDGCRQATADAITEVHDLRSRHAKLEEANAQVSCDLEGSKQETEAAESARNDALSRIDTFVASEEALKSEVESAVSAEAVAKSVIERMKSEYAAATENWQRQLSEIQDQLAQSDTGAVRTKQGFDKVLLEEKDKHRVQMEALQSRLAGAENDVHTKTRDVELFKQSIQERYTREENRWREALNKADRDLANVVEAKKVAISALEAAEQAVNDRVSNARNAGTNTSPDSLRPAPLANESALLFTTRDDSTEDTPCQSSLHPRVLQLTTNDTPNMGTGPVTMPPGQRRKVDRSAHNTGPIMAPEVIRPKSREAHALTKVPGPVVDESQFGRYAASYPKDSQAQLELRTSLTANSDEMLDAGSTRALPETVPEIQFDEALLTFADFKNAVSSSEVPVATAVASQSRYFTWNRKPLVNEPQGRGVSIVTLPVSDAQDFHIYEDPQQRTEEAPQVAAAPKMDYTFRKTIAKPNSASKRTASYGSVHDYPRTALQPLPSTDRYKTPEPTRAHQAKIAGGHSAMSGNHSNQSSSPPFVPDHGGRSQSQYHTVAGSAKPTPRTSAPYATVDPRLAGRSNLNKRSAPRDTQVERPGTAKRRQTTSNVATRSQGISSGVGLVSGSSQSVNDLPRIVDPSRRGPTTSGAGNRMQRFAGGSSRSTATAKKASKNSQFSNRFSQELVRRRKPVKLTPSALHDRTAQLENLENKLEHLVHALSAQHQQQTGELSPPDSQPQNDSSGPATGLSHVEEVLQAVCDDKDPNGPGAYRNGSGVPTVLSSASEYLASARTLRDDTTISMQEAGRLFERYQRLMAPNNPFVVLPPHTDVWELAQERPFLMQAIVAVSLIDDLPRSHRMCKDVMRQLGERMLMNSEKSMELLQGILVVVNWWHMHLHDSQQSTNLIHLAMALVTDLNIDRAPGTCSQMSKEVSHGPMASKTPKAATSDERRALLGTYYLGSMLSTSFHKLEPLNWTPWMSQSLEVLERMAEYESDVFLVRLVNAQHIQEQISTASLSGIPIAMTSQAYAAQLDRITVPPTISRLQYLLQLQLANARISLWDRSFQDLLDDKSKHSQLQSRLPDIWRFVSAVKDYADVYFSVPVSEYLTLPFPAFAQFGYAFISLMRLATMDVSGWDAKCMREHLDFGEIMERCSARFEAVEASGLDGLTINNDAFTRWAQKTRWLKQFFDSKMNPETARPLGPVPEGLEKKMRISAMVEPTATDGATQGLQGPTPPGEGWMGAMGMEGFTYFDEAFWNSFNVGDFDFGLDMSAV